MPDATREGTTRRHPVAGLETPFVWLVVRLRVPPTAITLLSVPLGVLAAALLATHHYWLAIAAVIAAGGADAVDGEAARRTGRTSRAGGYLDSLSDRIVDACILAGFALGVDESRSWIAALIALFGILTTSAAKWRIAEAIHVPDAVWGRDLIERTDRFLLMLAGILAAAVLAPRGLAPDAVFVLLVVLAALTNLTVAQRILKAWRLLRAEDQAAQAIPVAGDRPSGEKDTKD